MNCILFMSLVLYVFASFCVYVSMCLRARTCLCYIRHYMCVRKCVMLFSISCLQIIVKSYLIFFTGILHWSAQKADAFVPNADARQLVKLLLASGADFSPPQNPSKKNKKKKHWKRVFLKWGEKHIAKIFWSLIHNYSYYSVLGGGGGGGGVRLPRKPKHFLAPVFKVSQSCLIYVPIVSAEMFFQFYRSKIF